VESARYLGRTVALWLASVGWLMLSLAFTLFAGPGRAFSQGNSHRDHAVEATVALTALTGRLPSRSPLTLLWSRFSSAMR